MQIMATPFVWRDPSTIPRRRWIYGGHYVRGFVSATISPGGIGKSSLAIVEALAIVTGRPLLGVVPDEPGRVWIWNGEDPREELERRIAAACLHYGIEPGEVEDRLFIDSGRDMPITMATTDARAKVVLAEPVIEEVKATIVANGIDVVIVDPFVSSHRVFENDNMAI